MGKIVKCPKCKQVQNAADDATRITCRTKGCGFEFVVFTPNPVRKGK
jgi:phage FluMu protein Com